MKVLVYVIFSLLTIQQCKQELEIVSIKLENQTRGYQESILIDNQLVLLHNKSTPNEELQDTVMLTDKDWKEMLNIINLIPLNTIENLEAPSSESSVDRTPMQHIEIELVDGSVLSSPVYDMRNPPIQLQTIVHKLKELSEVGS